MKVKMLFPFAFAVLVVPGAYAQSNSSELNAVLQHLSSEVRAGNSNRIGLDITLDGNVIRTLVNLNMFEIQKAAIEPYMVEICDRLEYEDVEIAKIGGLFNSVIDAEANAIEDTYQSIVAGFRNDAFLYTHELTTNGLSSNPELKIDWVQFSEQRPQTAESMFRKACEKFQNPSHTGDIPLSFEGIEFNN